MIGTTAKQHLCKAARLPGHNERMYTPDVVTESTLSAAAALKADTQKWGLGDATCMRRLCVKRRLLVEKGSSAVNRMLSIMTGMHARL